MSDGTKGDPSLQFTKSFFCRTLIHHVQYRGNIFDIVWTNWIVIKDMKFFVILRSVLTLHQLHRGLQDRLDKCEVESIIDLVRPETNVYPSMVYRTIFDRSQTHRGHKVCHPPPSLHRRKKSVAHQRPPRFPTAQPCQRDFPLDFVCSPWRNTWLAFQEDQSSSSTWNRFRFSTQHKSESASKTKIPCRSLSDKTVTALHLLRVGSHRESTNPMAHVHQMSKSECRSRSGEERGFSSWLHRKTDWKWTRKCCVWVQNKKSRRNFQNMLTV